MISASRCDLVLATTSNLTGNDEFALGWRQLLQRLPHRRLWHGGSSGEKAGASILSPAQLLIACRADSLLVIVEPALIVAKNLVVELQAGLAEGYDCVLPDDARNANSPPIDYATQASFDDYVARLASRPRFVPWDGRRPLIYLVGRQALADAVAGETKLSWHDLPARCRKVGVAQHTWIHDWSAYQQMPRSEMLALLPQEVTSLLDIGGGEGGFVRAFLAERGGEAHLLEPSAAAEVAQAAGLTVWRNSLENFVPPRRYQAASMLDVLEHLEDPLAGLLAVRRALEEGGYLLLSVPNIGFWRIVADLLAGRFDYLPLGILCATHLRFFTAYSLRALLAEAGFRIASWRPVLSPPPAHWLEKLRASGLPLDEDNLAAESFHVLARRD